MATYIVVGGKFTVTKVQLMDYVAVKVKQRIKFDSNENVIQTYPGVVSAIADYILEWFNEGQIVNQSQLQIAYMSAVNDLGIDFDCLDNFVIAVSTNNVSKGI